MMEEREALVALGLLVMELANGDACRAKQASGALCQAIESYHHRRSDLTKAAEAKRELDRLARSLQETKTAVDKLSVTSLAAFLSALGRGRLSGDHPPGIDDATAEFLQGLGIGKIKSALKGAETAAEFASKQLPNKRSNMELNYLAYQVGRTMREHLDLEPMATRDGDVNVNGIRGGGNYARLLREVLRAVGAPVEDVRRYMKEGLSLLRDEELGDPAHA